MPPELVFVDTSGWFASLVPSDPDHASAQAWLRANQKPLFTTDYILDESLTLLRARGQFRRAEAFGESLLNGELATLRFLTEEDIREAWRVFTQFHDKEWSFTDCTSRVVMDRLQIPSAFAFDRHFSQFGNVLVIP